MDSILATTVPGALSSTTTAAAAASVSKKAATSKKSAAAAARAKAAIVTPTNELLAATDAILAASTATGAGEYGEILGEQDLLDLEAARQNPKLAPMIKNIDSLVEKTQKARKDLELMMQTSVDLKNQVLLQEQECVMLEQDQNKVTEEMMDMKKRVDILSREKALLEVKLAELRLENDEMEAFLVEADKPAMTIMSQKAATQPPSNYDDPAAPVTKSVNL